MIGSTRAILFARWMCCRCAGTPHLGFDAPFRSDRPARVSSFADAEVYIAAISTASNRAGAEREAGRNLK